VKKFKFIADGKSQGEKSPTNGKCPPGADTQEFRGWEKTSRMVVVHVSGVTREVIGSVASGKHQRRGVFLRKRGGTRERERKKKKNFMQRTAPFVFRRERRVGVRNGAGGKWMGAAFSSRDRLIPNSPTGVLRDWVHPQVSLNTTKRMGNGDEENGKKKKLAHAHIDM